MARTIIRIVTKKEMRLQDFLDVEYIALETNDEFLTGANRPSVGKDYMTFTNRVRSNDEIFIFDRAGKGVRKINRLLTFINNDVAFITKLEAFELVEAYKKGELKGKLKEVAAGLNEESNPVIMFAKWKK